MRRWSAGPAAIMAVVAALVGGFVLAGCGPSDSRTMPAVTTSPVATTDPASGTVAASALPGLAPAAAPFGAFGQIKATIRLPDGTTRTPCLLVARTEAQRDRGLMEVTDASLSGHAGMLFAFPGDVTGSFWMQDTVIPLSIAFVDHGGHQVSSTDMVPCPTGTTCTTYQAAAAYRWAIEVPAGALPALGLGPDSQATVTVGGACPS